VRCARCGNENPDANRFCGMCGATLLSTAPVSSVPTASASRPPAGPSIAPAVPAQPQGPVTPRTSAPVSDETPVISGPSFLGLNDPPPRKRASLSADPDARSSNLDYLLEDEDEPRRGGAGKYILILLALALAVGFGYLRWKNQQFGWLGLGTSKPSAAAQNSDAADTNSTTPPASTSTSAPAATPSIQPVTDAAPPAASPVAGSTKNAPTGPAPAGAAPTSDAASSTAASRTAAPASSDSADSDPEEGDSDSSATANPKPSKPADEPPPKPPAAINPPKPVDSVAEAQKYLYGKGVPQDCDRGLRLLKPAANQSNSKAMIEMGALYSAGLCTPRDLPTAYRWFARALHKDPENQGVQNDLQKLWGEMTQPERQLAIKLSQ
jgi:hypothetical protein